MTIQNQIQTRIETFVAELTQLVRAAAIESVQAALGSGSSGARRGPGRPRGSTSGSKKRAMVPVRPPKKGGRRTSQDVDTLTAKFLGYVKSNDGKRLEEISRALAIPSAELKLPAQKLLAARAVKTSGQKRGTRYHLAGKAASAKTSAPRKAGKAAKRNKAKAKPKASANALAAKSQEPVAVTV